jgi:glycolate dehydrogenase iron-sulfur subunit
VTDFWYNRPQMMRAILSRAHNTVLAETPHHQKNRVCRAKKESIAAQWQNVKLELSSGSTPRRAMDSLPATQARMSSCITRPLLRMGSAIWRKVIASNSPSSRDPKALPPPTCARCSQFNPLTLAPPPVWGRGTLCLDSVHPPNAMQSLERLTRPIEGQQVFTPELPRYDFLRHCVRCARCLPVCPTYQETLLEVQSPRGRLALIKAVEEGKLPIAAGVENHLYHCLDCRMCNTVCPAYVPIGQSILAARAAFGEHRGHTWWRQIAFRHVLISAQRLGLALWPLRFYQRLGLPRLTRPLLGALPGPLARLRAMEGLLPPLPKRPLHATLDVVTPANGERRHRVGFFLGCMMSQLFAAESQATINTLADTGCEVVTPRGQMCCGSPQDDQGDRTYVRRFARANIALFESIGPVDAIVSDCAACSGMLKEYGELLHDEPAFAARARAFSAQVRDIYEWYGDTLPASIGNGSFGRTAADDPPTLVTIHDACHLANAQGVRQPQRRVLGRIRSIHVVEMQDPSACCGSAGIYNITHPDMANKRLERKLANIEATGASVVVTNGPGCLLQLRAAVRERGMKVEIKHISQLTAEALGISSPDRHAGSVRAGRVP